MELYKANIEIKDKEGNNIFKQLTYSELVNRIERFPTRMNRFNIVSWLIGYNGVVTGQDYENIIKAYEDNFID